MTTPLQKSLCPKGYEIYNFGRPLLHTRFVSSMPGSWEVDLNKNAVLLYDLYGHALTQEPLPAGS